MMRSQNGLESLDAIPLDERKKQIKSVTNKFNKSNVVNFGNNFTNWIVNNITEKLQNDIRFWKIKDTDAKKSFVKSMIYFLATYKQITVHKVNFKPADPKSPDIIGGNTDGNFTFYNALLDTQDIAEVMGYLAHEITHAFQDAGQSTLSPELNDICKTYYVNSEEDDDLYNRNPKEQEANIIEKIVKQGIQNNFRIASENDIMLMYAGMDR